VRDFIIRAANELGITITFEGQGLEEVGKVAAIDSSKADPNITVAVGDVLVGVDAKYYRPTEVETLLGDPTKAKTKLGWQPTTTLDEMIKEMIDTDLIAARKNRLLVREGYEVNQTRE
jgi:GDPmannose 4,6-dehydratase